MQEKVKLLQQQRIEIISYMNNLSSIYQNIIAVILNIKIYTYICTH